MKRINLPDKEMKQVVELRQGGQSFLAIEKDTGIPRRVAQRVYKEWEQQHSTEELKTVRRDIATKEFRVHLDTLTSVALRFVKRLDVIPLATQPSNAEEYLASLWREPVKDMSDIARAQTEKDLKRTIRQNHMLFESLKEHTMETVRWEAFEDWQSVWDNCTELLSDWSKVVADVVKDARLQNKNTLEGISVPGDKQDVSEEIVNRLLQAVWDGVAEEKSKTAYYSWRIQPIEGQERLQIVERNSKLMLDIVDVSLSDTIKQVADTVVQALYATGRVNEATEAVRKLRRVTLELDEALDPLILRPVIIRTRCRLCPI